MENGNSHPKAFMLVLVTKDRSNSLKETEILLLIYENKEYIPKYKEFNFVAASVNY